MTVLKAGCRGQESCTSHKALQTDSSHLETINNEGEKSMKPELLTNREAAITTDNEKNVPARAYELYEVHGRIHGHAEEDKAPTSIRV